MKLALGILCTQQNKHCLNIVHIVGMTLGCRGWGILTKISDSENQDFRPYPNITVGI